MTGCNISYFTYLVITRRNTPWFQKTPRAHVTQGRTWNDTPYTLLRVLHQITFPRLKNHSVTLLAFLQHKNLQKAYKSL